MDFISVEVNILISILLIFRSNFRINLQNSLITIVRNVMDSLMNLNASVLLNTNECISLNLYSPISPVKDLLGDKQNLEITREKSIVPYISPKNYLTDNLELCTTSSETFCLEEDPVKETFMDPNLYLHALALREILSESKTEESGNALKVRPEHCKLLMSCLSEMLCSPTLLPPDLIKLTQKVVQEIHSTKVNNCYQINERTVNKLVSYSNNLITELKEKYINDRKYKYVDSIDSQTEHYTETIDSIKEFINSETLVRVTENEMTPITWFIISHIREKLEKEATDQFQLSKQCLHMLQNNTKICHNSNHTTNLHEQVILLAHLNKLKKSLTNFNQNDICILTTENIESLFCILEFVRNRTKIMNTLEIDDEFLNLFRLNIIQNCTQSSPIIMNSNSMKRIHQILDQIYHAEFNEIQTSILYNLRDLSTSSEVQNINGQLINDLILGQTAIMSYSEQLNISLRDIDSLRDYCLFFQQCSDQNVIFRQTIHFTNFLSSFTNNHDNNSLECLDKDVLHIRLKRLKEFYDRTKTSKKISSPLSAYRLLFNTIELEHLAQLHSLEIDTIPESLKCSIVSMLTMAEQLFPYGLKEEESMYINSVGKQLISITSKMSDVSKAIHPIELTICDNLCLSSNKEENHMNSLPLPGMSNHPPLLSTTSSTIFHTTISKKSMLQNTNLDIGLPSQQQETINIDEDYETNSVIEKFTNICVGSSLLKSLTSNNDEDFILRPANSIQLATLFHQARLDEKMMKNLTSDEVEEMDHTYFKLLEYSVQRKTFNVSDVFNSDNLIQQNIVHKVLSYMSELEIKTHEALNVKIKNLKYVVP
ncbi:unnamed protein product [Heterobilharzia americana]|nr:unnamed protein product [Heterobilharzia americana]